MELPELKYELDPFCKNETEPNTVLGLYY